MTDRIDAAALKEMMLCADSALHANIQIVNDLNVFPVPDGDTGTNMGLTVNNAAVELRKKDFDSVSAVADCIASALLRGARGNSGVITSLLFRGIYKSLKGKDTADASEFAAALDNGVKAAYKAVMKPAEGTILTVSRLSAAAAVEAVKAGAGMEEMFSRAISAGDAALAETMNMNPVLKKAGVIDAGGMGYMLILKAMFASLKGEMVAGEAHGEIPEEPEETGSVFTGEGVDLEDITFTFDTVYVVRKNDPDVDLDPLREYLGSIGDSLVIGEDDETFKVHVHTDIPGEALTESQKYGTLELAKIENMRSQAEALKAGKQAKSTDDLAAIEEELEKKENEDYIAEPEKEYGIVTVCAGDGMAAMFAELGADRIVTGGQTMNPSTEDILREVNKTPANTVFVFPNNKNIIMAAEQCRRFTDKKVVVIPTKTVPQGITALLNFNPDGTEEEIVETMNEAINGVHTAMVTYAARNSDFDGHDIHAGEYLALLDGALVGSYANIKTLFKELSWEIDKLDHEFITVYYGADVDEETANKASETIIGNFPDAEVSVVNGGQPVYYYMISIE